LTESLIGQQQQQDDPLIGRVIAASLSLLPQERRGTRMSDGDGEEDVDDDEFDFGCQYNNEVEEESQEDALLASLPVKPLNSIWDCEHLCIATQENEFGKTVSGWTCAYCPRPGNVRGYIFLKTVNATKALCHVLKLRGNAVGT
jgi:hypothetical protein